MLQPGDPPINARILLVDDEPAIRQLCLHALAEYAVTEATNGQEALALLERASFDLVLTDVMMPEMGGLELLRAIRAQAPNQVVVVMSGYADKDVILQALKANADDFIAKPINLIQLRTTVRTALERHRLREELIELKRMDRLKSQFLSLISHKLKTPATAISLFIQNLVDNACNPEDPDFHQTLEMIQAESSHLEYLIKDLLYYSEFIVSEPPVQREWLSLRDLSETLLAELACDFVKRNLSLHTSIDDAHILLLDRRRITFVLRAILENALRFTSPGGRIAIATTATPEGIRLTVADSGPGIPAEEIPKVFDKFYQVDPHHSGQVRGFGLGLYYAREFVQHLGGSIHLDSQAGAGTTVTILLPSA